MGDTYEMDYQIKHRHSCQFIISQVLLRFYLFIDFREGKEVGEEDKHQCVVAP